MRDSFTAAPALGLIFYCQSRLDLSLDETRNEQLHQETLFALTGELLYPPITLDSPLLLSQ